MERLLNVEEVAEFLKIKPRTVYQWIHEGYIPAIKLGSLVRFSPDSISVWLRKRETSGRIRRRSDLELN